MITLYHHGSSVCAAKVRSVLAEKSVPWDGIYVDILRGDQFDPAYKKLNPKAVVPRWSMTEKSSSSRPSSASISTSHFPIRRSSPPTRASRRDAIMDQSRRRVPASGLRRIDLRVLPSLHHRTLVAGEARGVSRKHAADFRDRALAHAQEGDRAPGNGRAGRRPDFPPVRQLSAEDGRHVAAGTRGLPEIRSRSRTSAMAPYVNRLDMLGMSDMWTGTRPRLTEWFERFKSRPSFKPALLECAHPTLPPTSRHSARRVGRT